MGQTHVSPPYIVASKPISIDGPPDWDIPSLPFLGPLFVLLPPGFPSRTRWTHSLWNYTFLFIGNSPPLRNISGQSGTALLRSSRFAFFGLQNLVGRQRAFTIFLIPEQLNRPRHNAFASFARFTIFSPCYFFLFIKMLPFLTKE